MVPFVLKLNQTGVNQTWMELFQEIIRLFLRNYINLLLQYNMQYLFAVDAFVII